MKRVAASTAAPIKGLTAVVQTLHAYGAGVILRNVFLRHFCRSIRSHFCGLFAAIDINVRVEAAPDEFFDLRVDERLLPAQRVVCRDTEHLVHHKQRVQAWSATGLWKSDKRAENKAAAVHLASASDKRA
jgi:hypothetical protein